jgi:hypothetical protein
MLQEEAIRRSDRDRKQQSEKINNLERAVQALESEKRQFQVSHVGLFAWRRRFVEIWEIR